MTTLSRTCSAFALMAAMGTGVSPAIAADFARPISSVQTTISAAQVAPVWDSASETAERHRYRRYRRDRGVDTGDVIAGVLVLGTIAAIASAASNNDRDRDARYRNTHYRDRDYRNRDYRDRQSGDTGELSRVADNCVRNIERNMRVESVDSVEREGTGWRVTGALYSGERFTCRTGIDGRIEGVDYGAGYRGAGYQGRTYPSGPDRQWSSDRYAAARQEADGYANASGYSINEPDQRMPAYPGGPIAGDIEQVEYPQDDSSRYDR